MARWVLASGNQGKLREFRRLFESRTDIDIVPQAELGVRDALETGLTFVENALIKARHASLCADMPAIADDSGIEIDALNGEPGIYSSRYATLNGLEAGSENNNAVVLKKMAGLADEQRTARFRAVIVFLRHPEDPVPVIAEGIWSGRILQAPSGKGGFGYDPLFHVPERGCSAAELTPDDKNQLSHRGKALQELMIKLQQVNALPTTHTC